jgi:hypothetical protein
MFERSKPGRAQGAPWSVIGGLAVFAVLLTLGYALLGR